MQAQQKQCKSNCFCLHFYIVLRARICEEIYQPLYTNCFIILPISIRVQYVDHSVAVTECQRLEEVEETQFLGVQPVNDVDEVKRPQL